MEMSVREARAQFAAAIAAAERGERVTITKNGKAVAEIGPVSAGVRTFSWDRLDAWRAANGLDCPPPDNRTAEQWLDDFNDPALTAGMIDPAIFPDEE